MIKFDENIKVKHGFEVPDNYFNDFHNKIMKKIENENENENENQKYKPSILFLKKLMPAAAILLLGLISFYIVKSETTKTNTTNQNVVFYIADFDEDIYDDEIIIDEVYSEKQDTISDYQLIDYMEDEISYEDLLAEF